MIYGEPVQIGRDSFARFDIMRRTVHSANPLTCDFCCNNARFQYGTWTDGYNRQPEFDTHVFCSKGCWDTYNDHI
jgi:hypothetical protein